MTTNLNVRVKKAHQKDPLTPLVDRWLIERKRNPKPWLPPKNYPRPPGRFTPSNMTCLRAAVMNFMGVEGKRKITPELQLIFDTGDWLHWMWFSNFLAMQEHFGKDVFEVVALETRAEVPGLWLSGRFDVHVRIHGVDYIIDVKTINDNGFTHVIHTRSASADYTHQLIRYLRARKVKRGLIFYFNKNDQRFKVFKINYSKEQWRKSVKWLRRGMRYMRAELVPSMHPDCTKESSMARYCSFAHLCYGKKSPAQLQAIVYEGKPSAEELWRANN